METTNQFLELLQAVTRVMESEGIDYAVTGSVASGYHGEPVVSLDVDLVVRMTEDQARALAKRLPQRFYRSEEALLEAARSFGFVNLIDAESGLKVDLSVLEPSPFHQVIFERRRLVRLLPKEQAYQFVSAEDVILMKLLWRRETRSRKQWDQALSVVHRGRAKLDWKYLFEQADTLGIRGDLESLRNEAGV